MKCHDIENLLAQHIFGELDAAEAGEVSAHLAVCPACREQAEGMRQAADLLREGATARAPAGLAPERKQALLEAVSRPAPVRRAKVLRALVGAKDFAAQPWVLRTAATLLVCALLAWALLPKLFPPPRELARRGPPQWVVSAPTESEEPDKPLDALDERAEGMVGRIAKPDRELQERLLSAEPTAEAPPPPGRLAREKPRDHEAAAALRPRADKPARAEEERTVEMRASALAEESMRRRRREHTLPVEPPVPSAPMRVAPSREMLMEDAAPLAEAHEAPLEPPVPWAEPGEPEWPHDIVAQQHIAANILMATADRIGLVAPLTVFRLPRGAASYHAAREAVLGGQLPPRDSIRPEEFVNAFDYQYPPEPGEPAFRGFALRAQAAPSPFAEGKALVKVVVHRAEGGEGGEGASLEGMQLSLTFHPGRVGRFRTAGYSPASGAADAALRRSATEGLEAAGLVPKPEEAAAQGATPRRNERAFAALFEVDLIPDPVEGTPERLGFAYLSGGEGQEGSVRWAVARLPLPLPQTPPPAPEEAPRLHWAACAAEFARILREEDPPGPESLGKVRGVLERVVAALPESGAAELLDMVKRAEGLQP